MRNACLILLFAVACRNAPPAPGLHELLVSAARNGDVESIRTLVARGADPNGADAGENGWTPLMHAVHKHQNASIEALIDAGADPNLAMAGGYSPLMMASGYGNTDTVLLLLHRGATPDARDAHGETALDAALVGSTDIDRLTLFGCQDDTVRALVTVAPKHAPASRTSMVVARMKGCANAVRLATPASGRFSRGVRMQPSGDARPQPAPAASSGR